MKEIDSTKTTWKAICPYVSFEMKYEDMERYFGKYQREMDEEDNEPGPCVYWGFRYECGLEIIITYDITYSFAIVRADIPEIEHILNHLSFPIEKLYRADKVTDSGFNFKELVFKYFGEVVDLNAKWYLWRQDDNGVKYLVKIFDFEREANCVKSLFESKKHKQTYWIEKAFL